MSRRKSVEPPPRQLFNIVEPNVITSVAQKLRCRAQFLLTARGLQKFNEKCFIEVKQTRGLWCLLSRYECESDKEGTQ